MTSVQLRGYMAIKPQARQDAPRMLAQAAQLISQAQRPVILAGQGIKHGNAHEEFRAFVDKSGIPVTTTLLGIGGCSTRTTPRTCA